MKAIVCEMCGSHDLVKQNGLYVCQNCGTKYSVEEARNLMTETTEVTINYSKELQNLYEVARRARDNENHESAARYYDQIMAKDPTSWEAAFYSVYSNGMACKVGEIPTAASNVANCLDSVISLIHDRVTTPEDQLKAIKEVSKKAEKAADLYMQVAINSLRNIDSEYQAHYVPEYGSRGFAAVSITQNLGLAIKKYFKGESWALPLAIDAYTTANRLLGSFKTGLKPSSFLTRAPIHGMMENRADSEISKNNTQMTDLRNAYDQIKKRKRNEYWNNHKEEKAQLDAELKSLSLEKKQLDTEIEKMLREREQVPACAELAELQTKIEYLTQKKNALNFFQGKEKKALQGQMESIKKEQEAVQEKVNEQQLEVTNRISPLRNRNNAIETRIARIKDELNKDR